MMKEVVVRGISPCCSLMKSVLNLNSREYLLSVYSRSYTSLGCLTTYENPDQPKVCSRQRFLKPFPRNDTEPLYTHIQTRLVSVGSNSNGNEKNDKNKKITSDDDDPEQQKNLSLFQKFKIMYKKYWYVLVPVHIVTSIGWFGSFYYLAKSGVDIVALLESWNFSEVIIKPLRDSSAGYVAIAYALYKIATPVRYTVTVGGTTISINYLTKWGWIKPIPPKERLKEMYQEQKENLKERRDVITGEIRMKGEQIKEKGEAFMRDIMDQGKNNKNK